MRFQKPMSLEAMNAFHLIAVEIDGNANEAVKASNFDQLISDIAEFIDRLPSEFYEEITGEILRKVSSINDLMPRAQQAKFKMMFADAVANRMGRRNQSERFAMASLGTIETMFIDGEQVDHWAKVFSASEIVFAFKNAVPPKAAPIVLAAKFLNEFESEVPQDYKFVFDRSSDELEGKTYEERQRFAQHFVIELGIKMRDSGKIDTSPAEILVLMFGEYMRADSEFSAPIIEALLLRLTEERFDFVAGLNKAAKAPNRSYLPEESAASILDQVLIQTNRAGLEF